jgi:quercetin dioxygenase-like cupin family protein
MDMSVLTELRIGGEANNGMTRQIMRVVHLRIQGRKEVYMEKTRIIAIAVLIVGGGLALHAARAQQPGIKRTDRAAAPTAGSTSGAPLRETVTVAADKPISNLPGKRLVNHIVDYPPGASSVPHRHARSAFVYAYVLSGAIRSQVDDEPVRVYRPGETWFENPGSYHRVSENASDTEPARLLAVLVVDVADEPLVIPDPQ